MPADVIVLEADGLIDDQHGYAYYLVQRLRECGADPLVIKLAESESPEQLAELPHLPIIISGGMTEVTADAPWVVAARGFVRQTLAHNQTASPDQRRPLFGVCFGAQLIAETYRPGSVTFLAPPDVSVTTIHPERPDHALFAGLDQSFQSYTFHYNQINADDLRVLARKRGALSSFIEVFDIPGAAAFGVQFHPEFTHAGYQRLLATYADLLTAMGEDVPALQRDLPVIEHSGQMLCNFLALARTLRGEEV